ncbi:transketolase [Cryobacterium psychrophilum]|uniref:Transketolase n=1 Tax=Cryobacterium psychrophilum TaxID=41988 RepID=A0A4Y8KNM6_9MICO|nr:transketolase [Cryobacterium psychrophilum]TDW31103.1 transketolase [Cryobacterium psychrophilum]TFD78598.1 transketolase [Cryobacterium psychrophilum]
MATESTSSPSLTTHPELDARAVASARALAAHVVQAKGHGHGGTAMALAPLSHVLFSRVLRHAPAHPDWLGRDRFVLSAGHASLLLYTQLFFTGYGLTLDDLAKSRTLGSKTPGHPEVHHTVGVEMSTGPLGQGVASAVGMAMAARHESAVFTPASALLDHTTWVVAGDGCLQEGVSGEASSLAGTLGLDNLVLIWDDNGITIDSGTAETFSEDVRARYRAYGWRVLEIDTPDDLDAIETTLRTAVERTGRPTLVALRTVIGAPSVRFGGTSAAHAGGFGADELAAVKTTLGFAPNAPLHDLVAPETLEYTRGAVARGEQLYREWEADRAAWGACEPDAVARWRAFRGGEFSTTALDTVNVGSTGDQIATRKTNGAVLRALNGTAPLWGGSADLAGSTTVEVHGDRFSATNPGGEFIRFGIREHAMAAILNGIALQGPWRPFASTYLVFSDYMRPSIRLGALMGLGAVYVYTHDSVAVGEDGPTHQPVEQLASLRTVPGLDVVRPADSVEVVAAWRRILASPDHPVALILSRQDLPVLASTEVTPAGVTAGGYVRWQHGDGSDLAILATGSEVHLAIDAAAHLAHEGISARVVSMPCVEWFAGQTANYRESVLPAALRARVAVEAGRGDAWYRWVGLDGRVVSVEQFGESGSGPEVLRRRGIHLDAVITAAHATLATPAGDPTTPHGPPELVTN